MAHYTVIFQEHKEEARAGLDYYRRFTTEIESTCRHICLMQQQDHAPDKSAKLEKLRAEFSAFGCADYMIGKNLPHSELA